MHGQLNGGIRRLNHHLQSGVTKTLYGDLISVYTNSRNPTGASILLKPVSEQSVKIRVYYKAGSKESSYIGNASSFFGEIAETPTITLRQQYVQYTDTYLYSEDRTITTGSRYISNDNVSFNITDYTDNRNLVSTWTATNPDDDVYNEKDGTSIFYYNALEITVKVTLSESEVNNIKNSGYGYEIIFIQIPINIYSTGTSTTTVSMPITEDTGVGCYGR